MLLERFGILKMCYSPMFYFRRANLERMIEKYNLVVARDSTLSLGPGYQDDNDDREVAFQATKQAFRKF